MTKKLLLVVASLLLLIPALALHSNGAEPIKIGCLLCTTGDLGPMGLRMLNGARLAAEDINAQGGVLGRNVVLVEEDSRTDPAAGLERVKKMVEVDGVQVIAGPMITGTSKLAIPYVMRRGVPLVTPSATAIVLSETEGTDWFFRTCLRDDAQGLVLAKIALEKGYTRLASIVLDNAYGKGVEKALIEGLEGAGWSGKVVAKVHYDEAKKDYRTELGRIKDNEPDVVLAVTYADDGIIVFKQALEMGLEEIAWLGCDGNYGSGLFKEPKSAEFMEKAFVAGTRTIGTGSLYEQFVGKYSGKFGEAPETYCDTLYDAVWAIAKAIEKAGVYDGKAIRDGLTKLEFDGVTGLITFNELGDRTSGNFEIWEVVKDPSAPTGYKNSQIRIVAMK